MRCSHLPTALPPYRLTALPPYRLTALPPYRLTALPPYRLTALPPCLLTALPPYRLTALPPSQLRFSHDRSSAPVCTPADARPSGAGLFRWSRFRRAGGCGQQSLGTGALPGGDRTKRVVSRDPVRHRASNRPGL